MENQNTNEYLESLKQQLNEYQEESKKSSGRKSKEEILAKYFVPRNDKEIFRILPPKKGKKPIQEAFFHVVDLNAPNGKKNKWRAIYCPAHNDPMVEKKDADGNVITYQSGKPVLVPKPCPLCEEANKILKKQDQTLIGKKRDEVSPEQVEQWDKNKEIFKDATKWKARKYYIIRGIDKGNTKDGVKFWRFKKNFKRQGTLDRLLPVLNQYMEAYNVPYFDPQKGTDLSITMVDSENGSIKSRVISAIIAKQPSKLHEDDIIAKQWIDDPITWRDVFKPKTAPNITPHEYLELLLKGDDPYWDDSDPKNKHWAFPNNPELEAKANQRNRDLTGGQNNYSNFEQASDIADDGVTINNITSSDTGNFENSGTPNAVDVTSGLKEDKEDEKPSENKASLQADEDQNLNKETNDDIEDNEDYDDLPF